jgi:putative ABC transport system permease protein
LLLAYGCRNLLAVLLPIRAGGVPLHVSGQIDWRVLGMSAGVCLVSTLLFGVFPALRTSQVDLASALKCESAGVVGGRGRSWLRASLVLVQVALSFVLLVGAGLLVQSLQKIHHASPGFATDDLLVTAVDLFDTGYGQARTRNLQDQLLDRVQGLSGVQSATYARITPFSYRSYSTAPVATDEYQPGPDDAPTVDYDEVGPNYFSTMGIPLVAGRDFTRDDDESAPQVAVVNQAMAARYWRSQDPVGKRLLVGNKPFQVIAVAKNAKYRNMLESSKPFFYVALRQNPARQVGLLVRTRQGVAAMTRTLDHEIHALDPNLPLYEVISMREQVDRQTSTQQVAGMLLAIFGGLALLLATIGLYGVMSYAVSQSTRELGLRIALGAAPSHLLRLVLSRGLALTGIGLVLGLVAAISSTRLLGYLLYNVSPRDPLSFGSAVVLITIASLVACFLPAWRATRTDPLEALRDVG